MTVQIRGDNQALRVTLPASGELDMHAAIQLARDLIDAVTQCGFEVKMDVAVKPHVPTDQQIATAVARVGHIRRQMKADQWSDARINQEIVMRVLEACL